jgi:hypothetical protein
MEGAHLEEEDITAEEDITEGADFAEEHFAGCRTLAVIPPIGAGSDCCKITCRKARARARAADLTKIDTPYLPSVYVQQLADHSSSSLDGWSSRRIFDTANLGPSGLWPIAAVSRDLAWPREQLDGL